MRIILTILTMLFVFISYAGPTYVDKWPSVLKINDGVVFDPTPERCRAAGYELRINRPIAEVEAELAQAQSNALAQAQIAAEQAQIAAALSIVRSNRIAALRLKYGAATKNLCNLIGRAETNVLTSTEIESLVFPLLEDSNTNDKLKRNDKINGYMIQLLFMTTLLKEEDGSDALDRL